MNKWIILCLVVLFCLSFCSLTLTEKIRDRQDASIANLDRDLTRLEKEIDNVISENVKIKKEFADWKGSLQQTDNDGCTEETETPTVIARVFDGEIANETVRLVVAKTTDTIIQQVYVTGTDNRIVAQRFAENGPWKIWCCDVGSPSPIGHPDACPIACRQNETALIEHVFEKVYNEKNLTGSSLMTGSNLIDF